MDEQDASLYLGRSSDRSLEGTIDLREVNWEIPYEDSRDGCPGGWYRTAYASSVLRYARRRVEGGARVDHGLLVGADPQIWEAVRELEREEERAHAFATEHMAKVAARKRKTLGGRKHGR